MGVERQIFKRNWIAGDATVSKSQLGNPNTASESLFEQYLTENGYEGWTHEQPIEGKGTTPDYRLPHRGHDLFFEVKEFETAPPRLGGSVRKPNEPYSPVREKINQAAKQFDPYKEFSCSLVLANPQLAFVQIDSPQIVMGAMFGNAGFRVSVGGPPDQKARVTRVFMKGGKMAASRGQKPQNTTINSVLVLGFYPLRKRLIEIERRRLERSNGRKLMFGEYKQVCDSCRTSEEDRPVRIVVYENPFARMPLSRELFRGPFDERWGLDGDCMSRVYFGEELRRLEEEPITGC